MAEETFRASLHAHRELKETSREAGIRLTGRKGEHLEELLVLFIADTNGMLAEHASWVEEKFSSVRNYLKDISDAEIKEIFLAGLQTFVTMYFRLLRKTTPDTLSQLRDPLFRRDLIHCFFTDFILALRAHKKEELTPQMALELARLSYRHNPHSLLLLQKQYPDVDPGVITRVAVNYPTDSAAFIEKVTKSIVDLQKQYPDVDPGVITRAAVNYPTDSAAFIEKVTKSIVDLQKQYPDVDPGVIKHAAVGYPTDPSAFIEKVQKSITELQEKYPDVDPGVIKHAAIHYPTDPSAFIEKVQKSITELQEKYPDVDPGVITRAAVGYPTDPAAFIEKQKQEKAKK